jgi:hypothetical protein
MPNEPEKQSQIDEKGGYKIPTDIWMSKASFGLYMLGITDYPIALDAKTELDLDRDNFLKALNAKLVDESEITVGGVSGRQFTGVSEKYTFKSRMFYINKRTYSVVAAEPTSSIDAGRVKAFLDSFTFGK